MSRFSVRELMYLGTIGAATLALGAAIGTGLTAATGIPMIGGLLNAVITAAVLTIGAKGVPKFGSGMILWFVMSVLAIPTLTMGPPGIYKVPIGLLAGLIWDVCFLVFGRRTIGYMLSGSVMMLAVMFGIAGASLMLGLPGQERLIQAFAIIIPINVVLGLLGTYLGVITFSGRVQHIAYVRRMLADQADSQRI